MKRVLITDDTKNIRILLTKCLELEGYQVDSATNGREGLEKLLTGQFDLAFLDIKLPELSGTEVLRRARAAGIHTPVIIITAYPTVKNAVETTQMGAITYLQKPFTADRLHSVLSQLELTADESGEPILSPLEKAHKALSEHNYTRAEEILKAALAVEPSDGEIYLMLADTYEGMGRSEEAQKFRSAAQIFR